MDALSSQKYWHFVRLMGRAASNITLECALATHPNLTLIGEEVAARHQNLASITQEIVTIVQERAAGRRNYGVVLIPEGLIEFVPEVSHLLSEINELLAAGTPGTVPAVTAALSPASAALFTYLPDTIKRQLLADRDPHGNVQVSLIETEKLLAELVQFELDKLAAAGQCPLPLTKDGKWPTAFQYHFFGYEGVSGRGRWTRVQLLATRPGLCTPLTPHPTPPHPSLPLPLTSLSASAAPCPATLTPPTATPWACAQPRLCPRAALASCPA